MTQDLVKDLLSGDEELRQQVLTVYSGLANSIDGFIEASYAASRAEDKALILTKLQEQIDATSELIAKNQPGKLLKFPTSNKPQA